MRPGRLPSVLSNSDELANLLRLLEGTDGLAHAGGMVTWDA